MKKALILGILGLAAAATQSFGQGSVWFDNYNATPYMPIVWGATHGALSGQGATNATIDAELLYQIGTVTTTTGMTNASITTSINPTIIYNGSGGYLIGVIETIPGYASGPVSFAVEAWNTAGANGGATFAASNDKGTSAVWTESSIGGPGLPASNWTGLPGPGGAPLLHVDIVPEPSIIALCGLGAAAFMVSRRKKA